MLTATSELYHRDQEQKIISLPQRALQSGSPRQKGKGGRIPTIAFAVPYSNDFRACLDWGLQAAYFVPASTTTPWSGRLPSKCPGDWLSLPTTLHATEDDGTYCVEQPQEIAPMLGKPGVVLLQPATSTIALGKKLRQMQKEPGRFHLETVAQALGLREADIQRCCRLEVPSLNEEQQIACGQALENRVSLIQGPPGTGKSQTIVALVSELLRNKERVLIASHTNRALDAVAEKLFRSDQLKARVTRYGDCPANLADYSHKRRGSPDIEESLSEDQISLVTLFRLTSLEFAPSFDTVILEEAACVSLPWTVVAAAAAAKRFLIVGDPCQLPPILEYERISANARSWFGRSIFHHLQVRTDLTDCRVTFLRRQYRMCDRLAELVRQTRLYPAYETAREPSQDAIEMARSAAPQAGELVVVDTGGTPEGFDATQNTSHLKVGQAIVSKWLRQKAGESYAVITPYAKQARAYREWLKENRIRQVKAGTVHTFQGSEASIVLWDTVEGRSPSGAKPASLALTNEERSPDVLNLMNVAVSRAEQKLVVLADVQFLESRLSPESFLRRVIDEARRRGELVAAALPRERSTRRESKPGCFDPWPQRFSREQLFSQFMEDWSKSESQLELRGREISQTYLESLLRHIAPIAQGKMRQVVLYASQSRLPIETPTWMVVKPLSRWPYSDSSGIAFDGVLEYRGTERFLFGLAEDVVERALGVQLG